MNRRSFFKTVGLVSGAALATGGLTLGAVIGKNAEPILGRFQILSPEQIAEHFVYIDLARPVFKYKRCVYYARIVRAKACVDASVIDQPELWRPETARAVLNEMKRYEALESRNRPGMRLAVGMAELCPSFAIRVPTRSMLDCPVYCAWWRGTWVKA